MPALSVSRGPMRRRAWLLQFAGIGAALLFCGPSFAQKGPPSVAPVAEKLIEAVVNISSTQVAKGPQGIPMPKVPKGSPFEEFFDDFFNKRSGRIPPADRRVSSLGSGFVVDGKEGLIVTNNHVIESADEIVVNFSDGRKLKVDKVLGRDPKTDLALLKVTPKSQLIEVKFGPSADMKVGDWVMAIGNPFGLGGSVTVGIISATQRDINSGPYDDFLQTDAAINKGNSGGPLFNMEGQVVGVNTAIISPTGGSIGIGFSVPSDIAQLVVDQLKEFGETRRGWLGVKIQSVSEDIAQSLGVPENTGALVAAITPGSPAATAGFEVGDLILKFDAKEVTRMRGLPRLVAQTAIGRTVDVEVLRNGEKKTFQVAIGRLTEDDIKAAEPAAPSPSTSEAPPPPSRGVMGLALSPLTDELRAKFGFDKAMMGLVVTDVDPDSQAAAKSIKPGDVIVEAAEKKVATAEDLTATIDDVKKAGRPSVLLQVDDGKGDVRFIAITLD